MEADVFTIARLGRMRMIKMACMMYQDYPQWGMDWSNNRRGYHQTGAPSLHTSGVYCSILTGN